MTAHSRGARSLPIYPGKYRCIGCAETRYRLHRFFLPIPSPVSDESRKTWVSHTWWARQDLHHVCGRVAVRARVARSRTAADVLTIVPARSRHRVFFSVSEVVVILCHACVARLSIWADPVVLSFPSWCAMLGGGPYDGGASNPFLPGRVPDHLDKGGEVHQRARP